MNRTHSVISNLWEQAMHLEELIRSFLLVTDVVQYVGEAPATLVIYSSEQVRDEGLDPAEDALTQLISEN